MHGPAGAYLHVRQELGPRSQSIDVGSAMRTREHGMLQPPIQAQGGPGTRTVSVSGITGSGGHMRNNSLQNDLKRPRLTVQIPGEQAEPSPPQQAGLTESPEETSAQGSGSGSVTAGANNRNNYTRARGDSSSLVLPPPSPSVKSPTSAGGMLSAGATGPKNPFARPPPPANQMLGSNATQTYLPRENETPLSALPSRFMAGDLLSSPSQFYAGEWGSGYGTLISPATYQPTPTTGQGPSWRDEERKTSDTSVKRE